MSIRLVAIAVIVALVGAGVASTHASSTPVAATPAAIDSGDDLGAAVMREVVVDVVSEPRSVAVVATPLATLTPRQHIDELLRPPRG